MGVDGVDKLWWLLLKTVMWHHLYCVFKGVNVHEHITATILSLPINSFYPADTALVLTSDNSLSLLSPSPPSFLFLPQGILT